MSSPARVAAATAGALIVAVLGLPATATSAPQGATVARESTTVRVAHASLQYSDTPAQKRADVARIFDRARQRNLAWVTGTEAGAGAGPTRDLLRARANAAGYRFFHHRGQDSWIAVRKTFIDGGWETHYGGPVLAEETRRNTSKGVLAVSFRNDELGTITVIACHYLTKGRPNAADPAYGRRLHKNQKLANAVSAYARQQGKGRALVFYGGDQNIDDRRDDTFLGGPLTSAGDELRKWPTTGHGPIDVVASYDGDRRVSAEYWRAYPDRLFPLHTDHFYTERTSR